MKRDDVTVATIMLARTAGEAEVLRGSLRTLATLGMRVSIADGGSPAALVTEISRLPNVTVVSPGAPGLVAQVRRSIESATAAETPFLLYTEPDKNAFFTAALGGFIDAAANARDAGMIIASRSPASFATFPPQQQRTESMINTLTGDVLGTPADYSFGPFLMRATLSAHVARIPSNAGWGWRHFMFVLAHRLGYRVLHVEGDHACPPDQRVEDEAERLHRLRQLAQNVEGLVQGMTTAI